MGKEQGEQSGIIGLMIYCISANAPDESVKKPLNVSLCLTVFSFSFAAANVLWSTETVGIVDGLIQWSVK